MQQEIETVDSLLVRMNFLKKRVSLAQKQSALADSSAVPLQEQKLFRQRRTASGIFQIPQKQNRLFICGLFRCQIHLLRESSPAFRDEYTPDPNNSKYFLYIAIHA